MGSEILAKETRAGAGPGRGSGDGCNGVREAAKRGPSGIRLDHGEETKAVLAAAGAELLNQDSARRACTMAEFTAVHASADAYRSQKVGRADQRATIAMRAWIANPAPALPAEPPSASVQPWPLHPQTRMRAGYLRSATADDAVPCTCSGPQQHDSRSVRRQASGVTGAAGEVRMGAFAARVGARSTPVTACRERTRPLWLGLRRSAPSPAPSAPRLPSPDGRDCRKPRSEAPSATAGARHQARRRGPCPAQPGASEIRSAPRDSRRSADRWF